MRDLLFRKIEHQDVAVCSEIESLCFKPSEAASEKTIKLRQVKFPEGFLVAERNKHVLGFINSGATDTPDLSNEAFKSLIDHNPQGKNLVVFSVAVHPDFQGQKISKGLMQSFIAQAKQQARSAILLLCKSELVAYYKKFGFVDEGVSLSQHGGFQWREMRYEILY